MSNLNLKKNFAILFILVLLTPAFSVINAFVDVGIFDRDERSFDYAVAVMASERRYVIPLGQSVGVDVEMDGVKVVEIADVVGENRQTHAPARDAGIQVGDNIVSINGEAVETVDDIARIINDEITENYEQITEVDTIEVQIRRGEQDLSLTIEPQRDIDDGTLRIGAWVKDSTSGIGTLTFYDPESSGFGALGHGITNTEGEPIQISGGNILSSTVVSVTPSERGQIGELRGIFLRQHESLGEITTNNNQGLYGTLDSEMLDLRGATEMPVATRNEVRTGNAQILSNIDSVRVESFDIEIQRIMRNTSDNTKEMVIRVTDEDLLNRVGGIVQGMSGSPIIQNDKVVGAVTHVFVNDPTRGYGIFLESMLPNLPN